MSYKRIMVAVDGSETSDLAFLEALHLSTSLQAELRIVHVVDVFPIYNIGCLGIDFDRSREIARNDGLLILDRMKQLAQQQNVTPEVRLIEIMETEKNIAEKLIEAAESYHADILVLGTHGRRGFRHMMLGSVAEEVAQISSIPVLLVRAKEV